MSGDGVRAGVAKAMPVAVSVVPFGMAVGYLAVDGGLSVSGAAAMSAVMFAGAAQIAALQLAKADAPGLLIVAVAVGINLRFLMYGAALAPALRGTSRLRRVGLAYLLTDQAFAITRARFDGDAPARPVAFYFGAALSLWVAWQAGTVSGAVLGNAIPPQLAIDFAAPLAFVALAASAVRTRADAWAAVASLTVFGAFHWLPFGLALLPAILVGVVVGRAMGARA